RGAHALALGDRDRCGGRGADDQGAGSECRGRLQPREPSDAREPLGRRSPALAADPRARRLDPPRLDATAATPELDLPGARRVDYSRDVRDRAGDGGWTSRILA